MTDESKSSNPSGSTSFIDRTLKAIGITMGCPVGIGPEIVLRFFMDLKKRSEFFPVVLGDMNVLTRCASELKIDAHIVPWHPGEDDEVMHPGTVPVLSLTKLDQTNLCWGKPTEETGLAMATYIQEAMNLLNEKEIAAMVTCPISKDALNLAGFRYPGHTEMLAALCQSSDYAMMMAGAKLRVTLVTIHTPLMEVPVQIKTEEVYRLIHLTTSALMDDFGISSPRVAVAGLNPHSGENSLFGNEEKQEICPAIAKAKLAGWDVSGPWPPDTVFYKALQGGFDAVVCMYHDQGLIPFKLIHFEDGVNVTLGLPIVRTSVDHGTAYDIAGKGAANPASLAAAYNLAEEIVENRKKIKR